MKTTTLLPSSMVLLGLVALAATSVHAHAQGVPLPGGWGGYGGNSGSNPYNSNPTSNNDGSNSNNDNNSNSGTGSSGGSSDGDGDSSGGSTTGSGSGSGSSTGSGNGHGNGNSGSGGDGSGYGGGGGSGGTTGSSGGLSPSFGFPTDGFDIATVMNFPVAHGALAATAFGFLFPLGAILVRVVPGREALFAHGFLQVLAYAVYIAGAGLGLYLVSIMHIPGPGAGVGLLDVAGRNAHPIIGIVLLVALFFQPVAGAVHHARFKRLRRRTWVSHVHLWTGRLGITLGIINGGLGFALAGTTGAPVVAYAVVSGVMWLLWLLTAVRGEYGRARAQGKARKKEKIIQEDRGYVPGVRGGGGSGSGSGGDSTRPSEEHADGSARAYPPPDAAMDMPSPPYTPGPHYEAHMAHVHQEPARRELPNMKEVMDRSDTVSYLSASHDEMNRGQV